MNITLLQQFTEQLEKVTDTYYFYTKGDANKEKDNYIVYSDTILGLVDNKIPLIGYFAVWLNELQEGYNYEKKITKISRILSQIIKKHRIIYMFLYTINYVFLFVNKHDQ